MESEALAALWYAVLVQGVMDVNKFIRDIQNENTRIYRYAKITRRQQLTIDDQEVIDSVLWLTDKKRNCPRLAAICCLLDIDLDYIKQGIRAKIKALEEIEISMPAPNRKKVSKEWRREAGGLVVRLSIRDKNK